MQNSPPTPHVATALQEPAVKISEQDALSQVHEIPADTTGDKPQHNSPSTSGQNEPPVVGITADLVFIASFAALVVLLFFTQSPIVLSALGLTGLLLARRLPARSSVTQIVDILRSKR